MGRLTDHAGVGAQTRLVIVGGAAGERPVGGTTVGMEVRQPGPVVKRRPIGQQVSLAALPLPRAAERLLHSLPGWEEARKTERRKMEGKMLGGL